MKQPTDYEKRLPRGAGILISVILSAVIFFSLYELWMLLK